MHCGPDVRNRSEIYGRAEQDADGRAVMIDIEDCREQPDEPEDGMSCLSDMEPTFAAGQGLPTHGAHGRQGRQPLCPR